MSSLEQTTPTQLSITSAISRISLQSRPFSSSSRDPFLHAQKFETMMKIQELHPHAERLPEPIAKRVVEYGEKRLQKYSVHDYVGEIKTCNSYGSIDLNELLVNRLLGKGSFSAAYQVVDEDKPLAIKVLQPKLIQKPQLFAGCAADLVREGMLLQKLNHPNILKCHAMGDLTAFASGRHDACFLLLDKLDLTLKQQLEEWRNHSNYVHPHEDQDGARLANIVFCLVGGRRRRRQQSLIVRTDILCQLAEAIRYLHANRILHRDLKPDNIGISEEGILKVFDLDVCRILPQETQQYPDRTFRFTKHVGSPRYMAPEVSRGEEYNAKADVYSFGLLCYEVLTLKKVYGDIPSKAIKQRVTIDGVRPPLPHSWPGAVTNLVQRCWSGRSEKRPTMNQVICQLRHSLDHMMGPSDTSKSAAHLRSNNREEGSGRTQRMVSDVESVLVAAAG